jgi:hypothetical protein
MFEVASNCNNKSVPNWKQLRILETKALRLGVWFRVLQRIDRILLDLIIEVVNIIRNGKLANNIITVTIKLKATKSSFSRSLFQIGLPMPQISYIAQKLRNLFAKTWLLNSSFIKFIPIMCINDLGASK